MAWLQPALRLQRDVFDRTGAVELTASLSVQAPGVTYWYRYAYNPDFAYVLHSSRAADDGLDFRVSFRVFPERAPGRYNDTLSVTLCHDQQCTRQVAGSPFILPLHFDLGYHAVAEPGLELLQPTQTTVLNHDVVGAAYSAALDAVVTASARPLPMLRVHDLRSGSTRSVALLTAPTSLSLAQDGLSAALGHDAAVSLVDLRADAAAPVRRFEVPLPVGAVVLAGTRIVAFSAQRGTSNVVHWLDTVTGSSSAAITDGFRSVTGDVEPVLHPDGRRIYAANRGVTPDDVARMDLDVAPAAALFVDTRYHGEYPFCGAVAASPDGRRLYTGCGVVLTTSPNVADDMVYAGRMSLSRTRPNTWAEYAAWSLSVSPLNDRVALLEEKIGECRTPWVGFDNCHMRLAVYDSTTLARLSFHGLPVHERGEDRLRQWGRRLMHRSDGSLLLVTELRTRDEATPTWLLHRLSP
ncbi:hypothetical protein D621_21005 [beta proteobacterium AAP51]|nr:hypothetical protein D621_21005 [beta proteobacterium AAP51]